ncbi:hypothetical protein S40288_10478 [Stachybotrys chartarum IBT 40288]|nr:hypothetical protein S40288_10478 [Stachybotrys chartarum IBT 40288]
MERSRRPKRQKKTAKGGQSHQLGPLEASPNPATPPTPDKPGDRYSPIRREFLAARDGLMAWKKEVFWREETYGQAYIFDDEMACMIGFEQRMNDAARSAGALFDELQAAAEPEMSKVEGKWAVGNLPAGGDCPVHGSGMKYVAPYVEDMIDHERAPTPTAEQPCELGG